MARVFLSHSSRDNAVAAELKAWLDGQGLAPAFLDFDKHSGIPPGAAWERTLYEEIQRCQALVILQTPNWSASRWCFAEFTQARALGKPVFQVVDSDEGAAEKPIAADLQRLDLRHNRSAGLEQLGRELERIALQDQGGFPWPPPSDPGRSPFPGLMVFEEEDAPVFFGRDTDWRMVEERLRARCQQGGPRLLVIQGSSGSGKSSLLRAGVLPRLRRARRLWLVLPVVRPQARPLQSLAQALALALRRPEAWRELHQQLLTTTEAPALEGLWAGWAAELRLAAAALEAQLLLPIDQAEELFTVADAAERQRFVAVLAVVLQQPLPLQAVMTIRADAMGSLQSLPELVTHLDTLPLGPLSLERYREIIEGPARVAGLKVEPAFVERAIHDTATNNDALPLLAFTLRQLHLKYGAHGVLSLSDYLSEGDPAAGLSPLENAVKKEAAKVLERHQPDEASLLALREAFVPAMVRVSEQREQREQRIYYSSRAAAWDSLPQAARPMLEALVGARLLVRRQEEGQPSTVEVAHEALLRVWPLLSDWLDQSLDVLLGSQQLEQDLAQWKEASPADKPRALLSGLKLARGRAWLAERGDQLSPELRAFIQASQRRAVRQRRLLLGSAAAAFAAISGAAGLAFLQLQRARAAQTAQFDATHRALVSTDPFLSVVYGLAATKPLLNGKKPWEAALLSQSLREAVNANLARSAPIATGQGKVSSLIELKNGELISGGQDGTLRRWRDGKEVGPPIPTGQGEVKSLIQLRNGELISGGSNGTLRRWRDGKEVEGSQPIPTGQQAVTSLLELKNGELISASYDGSLRRWRNGEPLGQPIPTGQGQVWSLVELRNGELVSGGQDGTLRRWRDGQPVGDGKRVEHGQSIATRHGAVLRLIVLRNGELISGHSDGVLRRWRDGKEVGPPIPTGQGEVRSLIERDNGDLISRGDDGTLRRWRVGGQVEGAPPLIATGQGKVSSLIELKNGELISGGQDGKLRRWRDGKEVEGSQPIPTGQGKVSSLIELKNGELISGGQDGTLRRWRDGEPVGQPIPTGQGEVKSLIELSNGELISIGANGSLRSWRDGKLVGQPIPDGQGAFSSLAELNTGELISGDSNGTLRRWRDGKEVEGSQPIPTRQDQVWSLIKLRNGELISGGGYDDTLRRWRDGKPVGDGKPIHTGQGDVRILIERKNGMLLTIGGDGVPRSWSPAPIAQAACRQIDLASIPTDTGLGPAVEAAQATCREVGVLK